MKSLFYFLVLVAVLSCEVTPSTTDDVTTLDSLQQDKLDSSAIVRDKSIDTTSNKSPEDNTFKVGAAQIDAYLPFLKDKSIALVVNQTSLVGERHLVDTLLSLGVNVRTIFAPEHGFRGTADAGEQIENGKDKATGLPVISLYGKNKKPSLAQMKGIEVIIFDIQDVGARFYTYISTMHEVMEACAEANIPFLVLDRPNPNGHYVDGPILKPDQQSFVGMHPIPIVHGCTVGELAMMINGEKWLDGGITCDLKVIPCDNYHHKMTYPLPIKPSPNLPNLRSILLYPSLCLFEGTQVSVGRGTDKQFQVVGMPNASIGDYDFVPKPMDGASSPKHEGKLCKGFDLSNISIEALKEKQQLDLSYLIDFYENSEDKSNFFLANNFFNLLAGNETLQSQIKSGMSEEEIRATWQNALNTYKETRRNYLIYE